MAQPYISDKTSYSHIIAGSGVYAWLPPANANESTCLWKYTGAVDDLYNVRFCGTAGDLGTQLNYSWAVFTDQKGWESTGFKGWSRAARFTLDCHSNREGCIKPKRGQIGQQQKSLRQSVIAGFDGNIMDNFTGYISSLNLADLSAADISFFEDYGAQYKLTGDTGDNLVGLASESHNRNFVGTNYFIGTRMAMLWSVDDIDSWLFNITFFGNWRHPQACRYNTVWLTKDRVLSLRCTVLTLLLKLLSHQSVLL